MPRIYTHRMEISIDDILAIASYKAVEPITRMNNTLGYLGIKSSHNGRYVAQIQVNNKRIYIGSYPSALFAALAYDLYIHKYKLKRKTNFVLTF